jgi:hypothetical protein
MTPCSSNPKPTLAQVGLGLFILWQIIFMIGANAMGVVPHGFPEEDELSDNRAVAIDSTDRAPGQRLLDATAEVMDAWAQSTGQIQAWGLFAPTFPVTALFPLVELRWDDQNPPVRLASFVEPENPLAYFRPPGSGDRLFHYEARISLIFAAWTPESFTSFAADWRAAMAQRIRRQWKSMQAYMRWQAANYQRRHPELPPPREVLLFVRIFHTPAFGEPLIWPSAGEVCVARLRMNEPPAAGMLPLEMCDPVTGRFLPMPKEGSVSFE